MSNQPFVPAGHFYSPITDVEESSRAIENAKHCNAVAGIDLDETGQLKLFKKLETHFELIHMTADKIADKRFFYMNDQYGPGDALILQSMIAEFRPRNIIEIGAGYSSAAMMDARDTFGLDINLINIDPYPQRFLSTLNDLDKTSVTLFPEKIQDIDLQIFSVLGKNDLLFVDSSHVLKTGSDLHHILFYTIPLVKPGVIIHFHDCFWPFEYPSRWVVTEGRSWNELYALRAFLMHNSTYKIEFFNDYFFKKNTELATAASQLFAKNPGGGLWIRVLNK